MSIPLHGFLPHPALPGAIILRTNLAMTPRSHRHGRTAPRGRQPPSRRLCLELRERIRGRFDRPLPVELGRVRSRSGFIARRSAEDLPPFRRLGGDHARACIRTARLTVQTTRRAARPVSTNRSRGGFPEPELPTVAGTLPRGFTCRYARTSAQDTAAAAVARRMLACPRRCLPSRYTRHTRSSSLLVEEQSPTGAHRNEQIGERACRRSPNSCACTQLPTGVAWMSCYIKSE